MKFSNRKVSGQLGASFVERVAYLAGCKPISIPEQLDTGVDGMLELVRDEEALGRLVAFQVKRGSSFFVGDHPRCQTDHQHLIYWRDYCLPVLLIIVSEDETQSFWMDVQEHIRSNPRIVDSGPYVLSPPKEHLFTPATLAEVIMPRYARHLDLADALARICDPDPQRRMSGIGTLYALGFDRRAAFCVASALVFETDPPLIRALCDIYSRYLGHPEEMRLRAPELGAYAGTLLQSLGEKHLRRILGSFESDDYDFSSATEIFSISAEEVWVRDDVFERASPQQGMALIVDALATSDQLLAIAFDRVVPRSIRCAAIAMFGYLQYSCSVEQVESTLETEDDAVVVAWLIWLRFWLVEEQRKREHSRKT